jgi:sugar O-acyltransferase (sialic acid O-acetyltransferase NeuD family)
MRHAVILGTGGHSRVVLSILASMQSCHSVSLVELGSPRTMERIMGNKVSLNHKDLQKFAGREDIDIFLAIGDNKVRKHWWEIVKNLRLPMPNLVSPHALIDKSAVMGESNVVCARAFVGPQATIGNNNLINTAAIIEHEANIGDHCSLGPSSSISGRSRLGDLCFVGTGAIVIDGISTTSRTVIGAGAVLVKSVTTEGGIYVGVPAKRREGKI